MGSFSEFEYHRQQEQTVLDDLKEVVERNKRGQFATPPQLAEDIIKLAYEYWKGKDEKIHFLEPGFGTGAFYSALRQLAPEAMIGSAVGIEVDPEVVKVARNIWQSVGLKIIEADFTKLSPLSLPIQPNLIVCNPPYIRHHHLKQSQKKTLQEMVRKGTGLPINGLAGMYCYFLLIAHQWLREGGMGIWLIPTEFMDVNYGKVIRDYLTTHVNLVRIHRFEATDVQFTDALVSSAVVIFEKTLPTNKHEAVFTVGGTLAHPNTKYTVAIERLANHEKWTKRPDLEQSFSANGIREITLGDLFKTHRGIATGANNFFIMPRKQAYEMGLPDAFLRPILPSPRFLQNPIIEADEDGYPELSPQLVLVDCKLPEEYIKKNHPKLWEYFECGKKLGIHKRYLASKRNPWYRQENTSPAPFLCTYMGRNEGKLVPFRFIWNRSQAIAPNVYLMLYPREHIATFLENNPEQEGRVYELLKKIDVNLLIGEGRTYGGGLHKIEPLELHRVCLTNIPEAQTIITTTMLF